MTDVTTEMVRSLRTRTGAGLMDCKRALVEAKGDMSGAADWLRLKGRSRAEKRAARSAKEGVVALALQADGGGAALLELNSETDFVARNGLFADLASSLAERALGMGGQIEALRRESAETIDDLAAQLGEKIHLRRAVCLEGKGAFLASYLHGKVAERCGRIGVLVALRAPDGAGDGLETLGRHIAMHIAASKPLAIGVEDLPAALVKKERALLEEEARQSGKPEKILGKIVEGRLEKFYAESALLKQEFVVNPDETVAEALAKASEAFGGEVSVAAFARLGVGEDEDEEEKA